MRIVSFLGLVAISVYHILNITKVLNGDYVWGGKIDDDKILVILETIALFITTYLAYIVYNIKNNYFSINMIQIGLRIGFVTFLLSTIGNLLSDNLIEKILCSSIALYFTLYFFYTLKNFDKLIKEYRV